MPWAVAGAIGGALISSSAAGDAADTQAAAADRSSQLSNDQYNQTRADQEPWRQAGMTALGSLTGPGKTQQTFDAQAYLNANPDVASNSMYGNNPYQHYLDYGAAEGRKFKYAGIEQPFDFNAKFGMDDFQKDPGYQFRMDEGMRGLQGSAAARGGLLNGGTLKALTKYGQDAASQEYGAAYNRFNTDNTNRFNRLSSVAGIGQTANNQVGYAGNTNTTNQINAATGGANAGSAAQMYQGNAMGGAVSSLGNWYQQRQMMQSPNTPSMSSYFTPDSSSYYAQNGSDVGYYPG